MIYSLSPLETRLHQLSISLTRMCSSSDPGIPGSESTDLADWKRKRKAADVSERSFLLSHRNSPPTPRPFRRATRPVSDAAGYLYCMRHQLHGFPRTRRFRRQVGGRTSPSGSHWRFPPPLGSRRRSHHVGCLLCFRDRFVSCVNERIPDCTEAARRRYSETSYTPRLEKNARSGDFRLYVGHNNNNNLKLWLRIFAL